MVYKKKFHFKDAFKLATKFFLVRVFSLFFFLSSLCSPAAKQLANLYPRFYNCSIPTSFSADLPQLVQLCGGSKPPLTSTRSMEQLFSAQGDKFISFVKSEDYVDGKMFFMWSHCSRITTPIIYIILYFYMFICLSRTSSDNFNIIDGKFFTYRVKLEPIDYLIDILIIC